MKLKDWLEKNKITQEELARDIGISQPSVAYYVTEKQIPRPETMQKIVEYTGGKVTANDFYDVGAGDEKYNS